VGRIIQKARLEKQWTQKELAQRVNEKPTAINECESGTALNNQALLAKLERVLGVRLRGKNKGEPFTFGKKTESTSSASGSKWTTNSGMRQNKKQKTKTVIPIEKRKKKERKKKKIKKKVNMKIVCEIAETKYRLKFERKWHKHFSFIFRFYFRLLFQLFFLSHGQEIPNNAIRKRILVSPDCEREATRQKFSVRSFEDTWSQDGLLATIKCCNQKINK
jgi:transcriptional regulator with XRE-family HTH domain